MRYEIIAIQGQGEQVFLDEKNKETDKYFIKIRLEIQDTESIADNFFRYIEVMSDNSMTGFEVDAQREKEVNNYLESINK